jgi:uncharacterized protein (TIGR02246 family)
MGGTCRVLRPPARFERAEFCCPSHDINISQHEQFFGLTQVWITKQQYVAVSDYERTIADGLRHPMRWQMNLRTLCFAGLLFAIGSPFAVSQQGVVAPPNIEPSIQAWLTAWVAGWNAHDADAIMRLHAEDCVTVNQVGRLFIGKKATSIAMENLQKGIYKDAHLPPYRPLYQRFLTPELVTVQVASHNDVLNNDAILSFVLKKNGDGWLAEQADVIVVQHLPTVPGETVVFPPSSAPKP